MKAEVFDKKILLFGYYKCQENQSDRFKCHGHHTCKFVFKKGTVNDYYVKTLRRKTILNMYQQVY